MNSEYAKGLFVGVSLIPAILGACLMVYILVVSVSNIYKAAQQGVHLTAYGVGGLCFAAGIVVGCLLYAC